MNRKQSVYFGIVITLVYFLIHLLIINDYGLSWDYHFHLYAGLHHLGLPVPKIDEPSPVPITAPDPRLTIEDPFGPIMSVVPVISQLLFSNKLNLLPFDSAYNLPSIIYGAFGVGILYFFLLQSLGFKVAILASLFLALMPNYFGYLHTNMKDIPSAVLYALAIFLFWKLAQNGSFKYLFWSSVAAAAAFNVKVNAVTIPVVNIVWYIIAFGNKLFKRTNMVIFAYLITVPLFALILWWPFWTDPLAKLLEIPVKFTHNTLSMPNLIMGKIYRSGINIPWYYPYLYIAITTPLLILISFIFGLAVSIREILKKKSIYLLFVLWFFVPLLRFFDPKVAAIDGIRHFMEIVFPLSAIAVIGFNKIYERVIKINFGVWFGRALIAILIISLVKNIVEYHPYQTSFYNLLIGGIKGAVGNFDIDFWATPQKKAMLWLNKNAESNAKVNVTMAVSSAAVYLREDLLKQLNKSNIWESDYVVILNRQSFWTEDINQYIREKSNEKKDVYSEKIADVPLFWVFKK